MNTELLIRCVYPRTRSIINNKSLITAFYKCQNFDTTKVLVNEAKELQQYQSTYPILQAIKTIESYPDDFLPCQFDRFIFEKNSYQIFTMINIDTQQEGRSTIVKL